MTVAFLPWAAETRDEFLAERRTGIGASDAAAVCGLSPWKTPLEVFMEKKGLVEPEEESEPAYWGSILESLVLREYARRKACFVLTRPVGAETPFLIDPSGTSHAWTEGRREFYPIPPELVDLLGTLRHPEHPYLMLHLDGLALLPDADGVLQLYRPLEAKTSSAYRKKEWGAEESDEIPEEYLIQAQHALGVLAGVGQACDRCDVPVLIGGNLWQVYTVERDENFFETLVAIESELWCRIEESDPPAAERSAAGLKALGRLYPSESGQERVADAELAELAAELARADAGVKAAELVYEATEVRFKEKMGAAPAVVGVDFKVTWKTQKSPPRYKDIAEVLAGGSVPAELVEEHRGPPVRVFRKSLSRLEV